MKTTRGVVAVLAAMMFLPMTASAKWPFSKEESKAEDKTTPVRVYKLDGEVREKAGPWDGLGGGGALVFAELLEAIERDARDPHVQTLIFKLGAVSIGPAQGEELAAAITMARRSGKRVLAHFESADLRQLAAIAAADEVHMTPEGTLAIPGLRVEVSFYKELLGTLGLEADIEAVGEFKSAMEPFTRETMSDAARKNLDSLVDSLFGSFVESLAAARKLSVDKVKAAIDRGLFTGEDAKKAGLVDKLAYWPEVIEAATRGKKGEVSLGWPRAKETPEIGSIFDLLKLLGGDEDEVEDTSPKVALLVAEGPIVEGRDPADLFSDDSVIASEDVLDALHTIEKDDTIKALVLRVDSPGGSALASDVIWRELARLNKKLPVVVSMGNVAASGGYYIASAGRKIFADPTTLTGSIGVFGGKMVYQSMLDKVGVKTVVIGRGQNAGMFSSLARFSDGERVVLREHMQHTYDTFVNRVAKGRNMSFDAVHKVAQGRVWTGRQAA
ncbi:MAG TPA: signal peptide peptidase SppA [Myxococcota bacterium]|nr:signal peptide peptidase SppA [Myxococcota bacterium]